MSLRTKLDILIQNPNVIDVKDDFKGFFISDLHMGIGDEADDFKGNATLCGRVLESYFQTGYTIFLLGDVFELWENSDLNTILLTYPSLYNLIITGRKKDRLFQIIGNHDQDLACPQSIMVRYRNSGKTILLVHGHQGDFFNNEGWLFGKFFVHHIWRNLQMIGFKDPTTANPSNPKKHERIRAEAKAWAKENNQILIMGHTHKVEAEHPYYNTGSCIGPEGITGIEIIGDQITMKFFKRGG